MYKVSVITVKSLGIVYKRRDRIKYNYMCVSTVTMQQKFKSYFPYSYWRIKKYLSDGYKRDSKGNIVLCLQTHSYN